MGRLTNGAMPGIRSLPVLLVACGQTSPHTNQCKPQTMNTNQLAGTTGRILGTTCRHMIRLNSLIDWQEVLTIVWQGLVTLVIMTYIAGQYARLAWHHLLMFSERMGKAYASFLVEPTPTLMQTVEPYVHPLFVVADDLQQMTVKEIKAITGIKRKLVKAQLVACAVALA